METVDQSSSLERYEPLGLMSNPFQLGEMGEWPAIACEVNREANRLLGAILADSRAGESKPLWVSEPTRVDESLFLEAVAKVEFELANNEGMNTLHGYVPLPAMRIGAVRAILAVIAERLVFRDFEDTLEVFVRRVLEEPHPELASYQLLGPDRIAEFAQAFAKDPRLAVEAVFGQAMIERQDEFAEVMDARPMDADNLGDEADESAEIDPSVGLAPGVVTLGGDEEPDSDEGDDEDEAEAERPLPAMILDYLVEYAKVHVSPVIARALRVYHDRGQVAAAAEFKVTKAPRKTLAAVVRFARQRFDHVVVIFAEFEYWKDVPENLRHKIVGSLSELRWSLGDDARLVFLSIPGQAPELEESFGASSRLEWDFQGMLDPQRLNGPVDQALMQAWVDAAVRPGVEATGLSEDLLGEILDQSDGTFETFIPMAHAAVESAADRRVAALDEEALTAAVAAKPVTDTE